MALPANILDLDPVDFSGKQISSFKEALWTQVFLNPELNSIATIVTGIKARQQVVILGLISILGKTIQKTNCAPDVSDADIPSIEKEWNPNYIEDRFTECWKNLLEKFTVWGLKEGIEKKDLTGTDFADFLESRILVALKESVLRFVWFGDTEAESFTDGGHIKDGLDVRYFNAIDGFWKQFYGIVAVDSTKRVTIAKNAGASFAAQKFTAADTTNQVVTGYLEEVLGNMDERAAGGVDGNTNDTDLVFFVTKSILTQYKKERRAFNNIDESYKRTEEGYDFLEFDGIRVVALPFMDRFIKAYLSSATVAYQPHRIYLTAISNLQIGVESEGALEQIKSFHDNMTDLYVADIMYSIDALVVEDWKVSLAY